VHREDMNIDYVVPFYIENASPVLFHVPVEAALDEKEEKKEVKEQPRSEEASGLTLEFVHAVRLLDAVLTSSGLSFLLPCSDQQCCFPVFTLSYNLIAVRVASMQ
jgi:hypothetical protein